MNTMVVDTDVISMAFKGDTRFKPYATRLAGNSLVASFMTVAELQQWGLVKNWGNARRSQLSAYLTKQFAIYPATHELCEAWAVLKTEARKRGRGLDTADAWIAATAVLLDVPLVTHNLEDFEFLPQLKIISFSPQ